MNLGARVVIAMLVILASLAVPAGAFAHGDEESGEAAALAMQPARALAQQAIALVRVRGDTEEAAMRLDAAVESKDESDVDPALLERAMETLDDGDPDRAVNLLDEALSLPLGSDSGKALHEAGREFRPAVGAQEVVAIVVGAAALVLGLLALRPRRRTPSGGPLPG
jgi:phosphate/sulfate permease